MMLPFAMYMLVSSGPALADDTSPPPNVADCGWGALPDGVVDVDGDCRPNVEPGSPEMVFDCDDADPTIYPGAAELCDGVNQSCRASLDDCEMDLDGDGYLSCPDEECLGPDDIWGAPDCGPTDPTTYPSAAEARDDQDNDCDGETDEDFDEDRDGFYSVPAHEGEIIDCDDLAADRSPSHVEVAGDGIDNDCDDEVDEPAPGDEVPDHNTYYGCGSGCGGSGSAALLLLSGVGMVRRRRTGTLLALGLVLGGSAHADDLASEREARAVRGELDVLRGRYEALVATAAAAPDRLFWRERGQDTIPTVESLDAAQDALQAIGRERDNALAAREAALQEAMRAVERSRLTCASDGQAALLDGLKFALYRGDVDAAADGARVASEHPCVSPEVEARLSDLMMAAQTLAERDQHYNEAAAALGWGAATEPPSPGSAAEPGAELRQVAALLAEDVSALSSRVLKHPVPLSNRDWTSLWIWEGAARLIAGQPEAGWAALYQAAAASFGQADLEDSPPLVRAWLQQAAAEMALLNPGTLLISTRDVAQVLVDGVVQRTLAGDAEILLAPGLHLVALRVPWRAEARVTLVVVSEGSTSRVSWYPTELGVVPTGEGSELPSSSAKVVEKSVSGTRLPLTLTASVGGVAVADTGAMGLRAGLSTQRGAFRVAADLGGYLLLEPVLLSEQRSAAGLAQLSLSAGVATPRQDRPWGLDLGLGGFATPWLGAGPLAALGVERQVGAMRARCDLRFGWDVTSHQDDVPRWTAMAGLGSTFTLHND